MSELYKKNKVCYLIAKVYGQGVSKLSRILKLSTSDLNNKLPLPILVCGLDNIPAKIARHYRMLSEMLDTKVMIYSRDAANFSQNFAESFGISWQRVPTNKFRDLTQFILLLIHLRPAYIEFYHDAQSDLVHLGYVLIATLFRVPLVAFCRGGELLYWERHRLRRKVIYWLGLRLAKLILYKELYMPSRLKQLRISEKKIHFFFNRIPVNALEPTSVFERTGVLFLNSWKINRRPDIAVEVGCRLALKFQHVEFFVVGERTWMSEPFKRSQFEQIIKAAGLQDRIHLLPFTERPEELFARCCVFLLPAENVFLNYALLEAMERGLVPVIAKVEGAERIVDHGKDGLIVDIDVDAFTEAVEYLLLHPDELEQMARFARQKVKQHFNLRYGLVDLIKIYQENIL